MTVPMTPQRTIIIRGATHYCFGTVQADRWPDAEPCDFLDYSADVTTLIGADTIVAAALRVAPSGTGEMAASDISVTDSAETLITAWFAQGVPGRNYIVNVKVTTAGGRIYQIPIGISVDPLLATYPLPAPPNSGFGPAITWVRINVPVPAQIFTVPLNSSVFYFDGELTGDFTPSGHAPLVPSEDYSTSLNSSVFYFDGGLTGGFTPVETFRPALRFNDARNSGLFVFRGQPTGTFYLPNAPVVTGPSQDFTDTLNSSVYYFNGRLLGAFTPT